MFQFMYIVQLLCPHIPGPAVTAPDGVVKLVVADGVPGRVVGINTILRRLGAVAMVI